jgi:uncharacterized membrane protein
MGLFSNQKSQFGSILEFLRMENAGIFYGLFGAFYGHLLMLWSFGIFSLILEYCVMNNLATLLRNSAACKNEQKLSRPGPII